MKTPRPNGAGPPRSAKPRPVPPSESVAPASPSRDVKESIVVPAAPVAAARRLPRKVRKKEVSARPVLTRGWPGRMIRVRCAVCAKTVTSVWGRTPRPTKESRVRIRVIRATCRVGPVAANRKVRVAGRASARIGANLMSVHAIVRVATNEAW